MYIDKDIIKYSCYSEDTILHALEKISLNKEKIVFIINDNGVLEGVLTDGDFRRWLISEKNIDVFIRVKKVANHDFTACKENSKNYDIQVLFSDRIKVVPIIDINNKLVAVATPGVNGLLIDDFLIDENSTTFVIAEIGNNHNGDVKLARQLIDIASNSGANCAKFQMRSMSAIYNSTNQRSFNSDLGTEYTLDLLQKYQLSDSDLFGLFDYCKSKDIIPLCTPWDLDSLEKLENYGLDAFKVASADLTNHVLLKAITDTKKPVICSTGMSTEEEIKLTIDLFKKESSQFALLLCNSTYPAPFKDINLNYLHRLKQMGAMTIGYSGHERGINIPIAAVAKGAKIIEKHITVDQSMEGNDHKVSLLPHEFNSMVKGIRQVEDALGSSGKRIISQGEQINRENLSKSIYVIQDIKKGEKFSRSVLDILSPGVGIPPYKLDLIVGKEAKSDYKKGDVIYSTELNDEKYRAKAFTFSRNFGVPVRYHDLNHMLQQSNFNLLEFHMSYRDLEIDITDHITEKYDLELIVHCPELFANDHILDICSQNEEYRIESVNKLQNVIEKTKELKLFFNNDCPLIVTNVGGFSLDEHLNSGERESLYSNFYKSLSELDLSGVELIPQTMPPFPWHFGGQRFHNLFVDPIEINDVCKFSDLRVCFDISHSKLACNYFNWSFTEYIKTIGETVAHLHIADASGVDGEGLQIGEGEIDFTAASKQLKVSCPNATFIPEVWQGHKNSGEGFWKALTLLEHYL
jgi:sialic acid synthase SpsE/sugar phosphate isomerase/epimerase